VLLQNLNAKRKVGVDQFRIILSQSTNKLGIIVDV